MDKSDSEILPCPTFLDIASKVDDLPTHPGDREMCHLFLGSIVTAHYNHEFPSIRCYRRSKDGGCHKSAMHKAGDKFIDIAWIFMLASVQTWTEVEHLPASVG